MWFFGSKKKKAEKQRAKEVKEEVKTLEKEEEQKTKKEERKQETKTVKKASKPAAKKEEKKVATKKAVKAEEKTAEKKVATKKEKTAPAKKKAPTAKKTEEPKEDKAGKKSIYRVVYDKSSRVWTIKKDGAKRTIATFVTKEEALARVKELSSSKEVGFIVHKKDGKFQKK